MLLILEVIHVSPTLLCLCELRVQTAEHEHQCCPECCELTEKYWPTEVIMNHKLYGTKEELQEMVELIIIGGVINQIQAQGVITMDKIQNHCFGY